MEIAFLHVLPVSKYHCILADELRQTKPSSSSSSPRLLPRTLPSPLAYKRQRVNQLAQDILPSVNGARCDELQPPQPGMGTVSYNDPPAAFLASSLPPPVVSRRIEMPVTPPNSSDQSPRMIRSMSGLEADSQHVRVALNANEQSDKSTSATYERHVRRYMTWWDTYQASLVGSDTTKVQIPAVPITAAKVTMFLHHESTRPKVRLFYSLL